MKVLILVGSGDKDSHSLHLGRAIDNEFRGQNVDVELINLIEYGLPLYDRSVERANSYDAKTQEFLDKSYAADAFVWVTPIYHNSYSSILKSALDWQHNKFPGKVVGLASNGGDRSPQAVDHLMIVARAQHLISGRIRVSTTESDFNEAKQIANESIQNRIKDFVAEITDLTQKVGA